MQPSIDITVEGNRVECVESFVYSAVFRWLSAYQMSKTHHPCFIGDGLVEEDMA